MARFRGVGGAPLLSRARRALSRSIYFAPDAGRDIFLASYPRSGNTWLRAIIYTILNGGTGPRSVGALNEMVPDAHLRLTRKEVLPRPFHVVKTHDPYRPSVARKAIYVLREPKAVCLSYLGYVTSNGTEDLDAAAFAGDWIAGRVWPCSWNEHAMSWLHDNRHAEVLLLQYEQLKADPAYGIRAIAAFIGSSVPAEAADAIRLQTSLENMMRLEGAGMGRHSEKRVIATASGALPPAAAQQVDAVCGPVWATFGGKDRHGVVTEPAGSRRRFSAAEGRFLPV